MGKYAISCKSHFLPFGLFDDTVLVGLGKYNLPPEKTMTELRLSSTLSLQFFLQFCGLYSALQYTGSNSDSSSQAVRVYGAP